MKVIDCFLCRAATRHLWRPHGSKVLRLEVVQHLASMLRWMLAFCSCYKYMCICKRLWQEYLCGKNICKIVDLGQKQETYTQSALSVSDVVSNFRCLRIEVHLLTPDSPHLVRVCCRLDLLVLYFCNEESADETKEMPLTVQMLFLSYSLTFVFFYIPLFVLLVCISHQCYGKT